MNHNLYQRFAENFPANQEMPVLVDDSGVIASYRSMEENSARVAQQLRSMGAVVGDRITVQVEKSVGALWLYLGCLRAGLVFHPLNTAYQANELEYFLGNAEPRIVIGDEKTTPLLLSIAKAHSTVIDISTLAEEARERPPEFKTVSSEPNDLAALLYSSGTTGVPKGIMLSHMNLLSNAETLVSAWGFTETDTLLHALPIFHVHGLFVGISCSLMSGSCMYWQNSYIVEAVLNALPKCSVMMGVPTYYTRLLASEAFNRSHTKSVRIFVSGSAPLRPETFHAFEERTGKRILERYGMTETGMNSSNPLAGDRRAGTVGRALPGVEIRITDTNNQIVETNEIGAVQVRGPNVFRGYWKLPNKTAEDFTEDGFFNTGDQGKLDDQDYLSIIGREKDMIISGGLNVYPKEIELLIDEYPGVKESAVFGVDHPDFGEGVVAAVVESHSGKVTETKLIQSIKSQLAGFKVPKTIVFLEELPRNTMGKVQKKQLRDTFKDVLAK